MQESFHWPTITVKGDLQLMKCQIIRANLLSRELVKQKEEILVEMSIVAGNANDEATHLWTVSRWI